jgi:biotin carboxylase
MGSNIKKTLLILAGGKEAINGIKIAKSMGLNVIVADGNPNAPGRELADDFINVNIYDSKHTLEVIKEYSNKNKINGVITIAADNPMSVALVANELNIKGPSINTALLSTNKVLMKDEFKKNNIPIPFYRPIHQAQEIEQILTDRPSEYVLKPCDSRGSRGVIRLSKISEVEKAWNFSSKYSKSGILILEEWIYGDQVSSESIVWNGTSYLCGLADRNYNRLNELYPFVVEDGGETPSKLSPIINDKIDQLLTKAANVMGLKEGSIKGDIIVSNGKLFIIETAVRLSGGYFSTNTIPMVYNYNLIEEIIKIAIGQKPNLPDKPLKNEKFQANRFLFLKPGKIKSIEKKYVKNMYINEIYLSPGDIISRIDNHTKRAGMVMSIENSRDKAISDCKNAINNIFIEQELD